MPAAAKLEELWLTDGGGNLLELLDNSDLGIARDQVGFTQAIYAKLQAFDKDRTHMYSLHAIQFWDMFEFKFFEDHSGNPRLAFTTAATEIFLAPDKGGMAREGALMGLDLLDLVEVHRRNIITYTRAMAPKEKNPHPQLPLLMATIDELDRTATIKHAQFYLGFRAAVGFSSLLPRVTC